MDMVIQAFLTILVIMTILLVLGVPISVSIGVASLLAIFQSAPIGLSIAIGSEKIFLGMSGFTLAAIPFFILAGNIMNHGGIAKRLYNFVLAAFGKLPGGLLVTNVVTNALFGAISGSASAAAVAVGSMGREEEGKKGYNMDLAAATNASSAPSGLLIPPSNAIIIYSLVSGGTSVGALFLAGYLPGFVWMSACVIVAVILAIRNGYKGTKGNFNRIKATLEALPALSLVIVVSGGIISGVFTVTEGSAIAVVYSLSLAILYKNITLKALRVILIESAEKTGKILFLIGASNVLNWVMASTGISQAISDALLDITNNQYLILFIINITLLIVGTFLDATPGILIFTPIFYPIMQIFGMHPVHFGLMLVYNLSIGNITPPVGNTLFVAIKVHDRTLAKVFPYMLCYYLAIFTGLLLVTYIPWISMVLPKAVGLA